MRINKEKILSLFHLLIATTIAYILSVFITNQANLKICDSEFVINYLGIFLGFTIALISFILSITDKLNDNIDNNPNFSDRQKEHNKINLLQIFKELKQDTFLIFWLFIIVIILYVIENIDLPFIDWTFKFFSKRTFLNQLKLTIFILSLYSIYDIITALFKLSESAGFIINKIKK